MTNGTTGQPWTPSEVQISIQAYFRMLAWQIDGKDFSKADVRREVAEQLPARSDGSIEFKWSNIGAVLSERGLPWVEGYKPLANYQRTLATAVDSWLGRHQSMQRRLGL